MKYTSDLKDTHCINHKDFDFLLCGSCNLCAMFKLAKPELTQHEAWRTFRRKWATHEQYWHKKQQEEDAEDLEMISGDIPHCLITVSLPPKLNLVQIKKLHDAMLPQFKYSYMEKYGFCFEFSNKQLKWHPHIHILRKGKAPKGGYSRVRRDLSRFFKVKENFVDTASSSDRELYNTRLRYLQGDKAMEKQDQVMLDRSIRKEIEIENYYLTSI